MRSKKGKLLFRCDGNSIIGLGHIYRSLALAQYLEKDFDVEFIMNSNSNIAVVFEYFTVFQFSDDLKIEDEPAFIAKQEAYQKAIIILDGYQFDETYVKAISENFKTVYIDDIHSFPIHADLILNHAGGIPMDAFKCNPLSKLCVGPDYAILRKAFLEKRQHVKFEFDTLICFGGADPLNQTKLTIELLPANITKAVVVGAAYQHKEELLKMKNDNFFVFSDLNADAMADLMRKSKTAVMSSSTVAYEYLSVSDGSLYIIQTADNQKYLNDFLIQSLVAKPFSEFSIDGFTKANLIDGKSPARILKEFKILELENLLETRNVNNEDMAMIYDWINDPEVRKQSYTSDEISFEKHTSWFNSKLNSADSVYYIFESDSKPAGQIRFELKNNEAVLGYLVAPQFRGMGYGSVFLKSGIAKLKKDNPKIKKIKGYVKVSNEASRNSFIRCNFNEESTTEYPESVLYTLDL